MSHFPLAPSSLSRIEKCPGSAKLSVGIPSKGNVHTDEGTMAHSVAETALKTTGICEHENPEIVAATQIYVDYVKDLMNDNFILDCGIEYRREHATIKELGGTVDCFAVYPRFVGKKPFGNTLHIIDYKHGAGVFVEVAGNRQLMTYAAIWLSHHPWANVKQVELTVVQPRAIQCSDPIRSWVCSVDEIKAWEKKIIELAGKSDLVAGDHCRWCPAKTICPSFKNKLIQVAQTDFEKFEEKAPPEKIANEIEWLKELDLLAGAIKAVLDEVRPRMLELLKAGEKIPGYKIIKTYGNRKYKVSDDDLIAFFKKHKLKKDQYEVVDFISPATAEKILGKGVIDEIVVKPETGIKVVPATERGESIELLNEFDDFSVIW